VACPLDWTFINRLQMLPGFAWLDRLKACPTFYVKFAGYAGLMTYIAYASGRNSRIRLAAHGSVASDVH